MDFLKHGACSLRLTFSISWLTLSWQGCSSLLQQSGGDCRNAGQFLWPSSAVIVAIWLDVHAITTRRLDFHANLIEKVEILSSFYYTGLVDREKGLKIAAVVIPLAVLV